MARPGATKLGSARPGKTTDTMRIAIFQKRYHANSRFIVKGLQDRGHDVAMFVFLKDNVAEDYSLIDPVAIPYGRFSRLVWPRLIRQRYVHKLALPSLVAMWRELSAFRPDVVILKKNRLPNFVAGMMARWLGAKLILLTNTPPSANPVLLALHRAQQAVGIKPARHISTTARQPGALGHPMIRGAVFRPYPIDLPDTVRPVRTDDQLRLLMVGKYGSERKRLFWLIEAAARAGLDPSRTQITLVGAGGADKDGARLARETAQKLGWDQSLTLLYNQPLARMPEIYAAHDLFVMTARDEPFGAVVLEAMAQGLPVISNPTVGASDCIVPEETGLLYPPDDLDALAACLKRLADNPSLRMKMGAKGQSLLSDTASPEAFARVVEDLA
jgi:glycosyltransferase involved in cell wall biosynthesis